MQPTVLFHRLVQRDMNGILCYYREQASETLADQFFETFLETIGQAVANPQGFHFANSVYRRANLPRFPYHFLYRETPRGIRILVLRHDRRNPKYGLNRDFR